MAATDPCRDENFRWHNTGLTNMPQNTGEYPVEFLYREVLSKEQLLEALSFFLVRVPKREAEEDKPARAGFHHFAALPPKPHGAEGGGRSSAHFAATGDIGRKYLIDHSAGSGKTLSICWLADRLHSLFKPGTNEKLVDIVFILTDRKSLDTNIREDIEKFTHLKDVVGLARKADDLPRFLKDRKPIIVTTQQKFAWVLEENRKERRVEEDARRLPDRRSPPVAGRPDGRCYSCAVPQVRRTRRRGRRRRQGRRREDRQNHPRARPQPDFIAFTATPAPATVTLFGEPFDTYSEAEAIAEGYIVDVAASIISYKTLYNLHCHFVPKAGRGKALSQGCRSQGAQECGVSG